LTKILKSAIMLAHDLWGLTVTKITIRLTDAEGALIEALRGGQSATKFATGLIRGALKNKADRQAKNEANFDKFLDSASSINFRELNENMNLIIQQREQQKKEIDTLISNLSKAGYEEMLKSLLNQMEVSANSVRKDINVKIEKKFSEIPGMISASITGDVTVKSSEYFKAVGSNAYIAANNTQHFREVLKGQIKNDLVKSMNPETKKYWGLDVDKK